MVNLKDLRENYSYSINIDGQQQELGNFKKKSLSGNKYDFANGTIEVKNGIPPNIPSQLLFNSQLIKQFNNTNEMFASDIFQYSQQPVQPTGGRRRKSNKNQENGGSVLGTLATPGVLLIANEVYKRKTPRNKTPKRGGSVLGNLAAPGVLLVANEIYKRKPSRTYKNKSRRFRKTRRYGRK